MKCFLSLIALVLFSQVQSQNSPVDFESTGFGAGWTWTVFENDNNPALEIITNPDQNGANTSATVAKFTARVTGQPWAGCETEHGNDIGSFTMDSASSTIKIMVWKSVISDVGIKLVESNSASLGEIKVANTLTNQWEELEFDFSAMEGIEYDQLLIFPDFDLGSRTTDNICYFDNVVFGNITPPAAPMTPAPDPVFDASNVTSIYSDVYVNVEIDTLITSWSSASLEEIDLSGNSTLRYSSLSFVGIEATGANLIDLDSMDSLHLNVWSPDFTEFKIKLVDFGADQAYAGGDDTEDELTFSAPEQEEWLTYDIALSDFVAMTSRNNVAQIIFSAAPSGSASVYVDNLLFYKEAQDTMPVDTMPEDSTVGLAFLPAAVLDLQLFPNPTTNQVYLQSSQDVVSVEMRNAMGQLLISKQGSVSELNLESFENGVYFISVETTEGVVRRSIVKRE